MFSPRHKGTTKGQLRVIHSVHGLADPKKTSPVFQLIDCVPSQADSERLRSHRNTSMSLRSAWSSASPPLLLTTERAMRIPLHVPKSHGLRRLNCMLVLVADPGEDEDPDDELAENGIPEKKNGRRRLLNSPLWRHRTGNLEFDAFLHRFHGTRTVIAKGIDCGGGGGRARTIRSYHSGLYVESSSAACSLVRFAFAAKGKLGSLARFNEESASQRSERGTTPRSRVELRKLTGT